MAMLRTLTIGAAIAAFTAAALAAPLPPAPDFTAKFSVPGIWIWDGRGHMRHEQSGALCSITYGVVTGARHKETLGLISLQQLSVVEGDSPRGDDVRCLYAHRDGRRISVAITRARGRNGHDAFEHEIAAVKDAYPGAYRIDLPRRLDVSPHNPDGGNAFTALYHVERDGRSGTVAIAADVVGEWILVVDAFAYASKPQEVVDLLVFTNGTWQPVARSIAKNR